MRTVASRELRNQTRRLLDRVAAGEEIAITLGVPVLTQDDDFPATLEGLDVQRI